MKRIEQASLTLLIGASLLLLILASFYILENILKTPPLFIEPKEHKSRTTVDMVLEAENLEGLKKICALWATQQDQYDRTRDLQIESLETMERNFFLFLGSLSLIFAGGSAQIYVLAKRERKSSSDAL